MGWSWLRSKLPRLDRGTLAVDGVAEVEHDGEVELPEDEVVAPAEGNRVYKEPP